MRDKVHNNHFFLGAHSIKALLSIQCLSKEIVSSAKQPKIIIVRA